MLRTGSRRALVWAALIPAVVTTAIGVPLAYSAREDGELATGLLVVMLVAAPVAAYASNLVRPVAVTWKRAALVGLVQVFVLVGLVYLMLWLQVRSGYLRPNTSEHAMSYGMAPPFAAIAGIIFGMLPVAVGARLGAYQGSRRRS